MRAASTGATPALADDEASARGGVLPLMKSGRYHPQSRSNGGQQARGRRRRRAAIVTVAARPGLVVVLRQRPRLSPGRAGGGGAMTTEGREGCAIGGRSSNSVNRAELSQGDLPALASGRVGKKSPGFCGGKKVVREKARVRGRGRRRRVGVLLRGSWFRDERKAEARWTGWMKLGRGSGDGGRDEQRQQAATVVNLCNARHNRQSHPRSIPLTGRDALVFFRRGLPQGAAPPSVSVSSEGRTALEPWSPGGSPSRDAPLLRRHVPGYDWLRLAGLTCPANSRPR
ncbi:hypothetical protein PCL_07769 [Purpureocillium lilacinum]|uniref:Uncharacterized protein n=1 Tax=Purpureocillium lilacinum TaxID=33203 RepID=A0A2U3EIV1_PURLI|nr:hypothetical protein PCL_07769 [Purpureocillium lilacinum]